MATTIDYTDSPCSKVLVNNDLKVSIFKNLVEKHKMVLTTPLGKRIGVEPKALRSFLNGRKIEIQTLEKLRKVTGIPIDTVRASIVSIDNISTPNLPFDFDNENGVRAIAGIVNEGRIRPRGIEYHNKNEELLKIMTDCSRNVLGKDFVPHKSFDGRINVHCLYFPPSFAKFFVMIKLDKPKVYPFVLPDFISDGPEAYLKVWLRACLSEEAALYPFACTQSRLKGRTSYLYPRIQLNRNVIVLDDCIVRQLGGLFQRPQQSFYKKDLGTGLASCLERLCHPLLLQESGFLGKFGIGCTPRFSRVYLSKDKTITATHSLSVTDLKYFDLWKKQIGFELKWQKKQLELILSNVGKISRPRLNDVVFEFYSLIPFHLRDKRKIRTSNILVEEQKSQLYGEYNEQDPQSHNRPFWPRRRWENHISGQNKRDLRSC